jgi:hypothetical protein
MENLQPEGVALEISKNAAVEKAKGDFLKEQDKHSDIAWENAVLFLPHALIYTDFHTAIRAGDTKSIVAPNTALRVIVTVTVTVTVNDHGLAKFVVDLFGGPGFKAGQAK